jgi:D-cysteine desulfhydrase family pyridoxal phosphate-dependent enzyme
MNFENIQRLPLTTLPTALSAMPNLSRELGEINLYIKRDDVMEIAHGGNKTRKLEYVFADALAKGADCVITMGGIQSNHVRQTVSVAAKLGLESHVVLTNPVPEMETELLSSGNYLMDVLMGANIYRTENDDNVAHAKMQTIKNSLITKKRKPYLVPLGASDGIGSLGYMLCAQEMMIQWKNMEISPSHIFVGTGSCGTHAGLLMGLRYFGNNFTKVIGISVSEPEEAKKTKVRKVLNQICDVIKIDKDFILDRDIIIKDDYYGKAYAYPTEDSIEAIKLVAIKEGILLDPVYTGKAMAGMIDLMNKNMLTTPKDVIFLHTVGAPALHPYANCFLK